MRYRKAAAVNGAVAMPYNPAGSKLPDFTLLQQEVVHQNPQLHQAHSFCCQCLMQTQCPVACHTRVQKAMVAGGQQLVELVFRASAWPSADVLFAAADFQSRLARC